MVVNGILLMLFLASLIEGQWHTAAQLVIVWAAWETGLYILRPGPPR